MARILLLTALAALAACSGATKSADQKQGPGNLPGGGGGEAPPCEPSGACPAKPDTPPPPPPPPDLVTAEEPEVVGAIPKDSIHRVVRGQWLSIRQCYETLLLADHSLEGRVVTRFKIGLDGTVSDATASGVHPELETCVVETLRKLRFPKPDGAASVEVTYPLLFKPG